MSLIVHVDNYRVMSTLKRKLLSKTSVCAPVMKRLHQPGGGGGGSGRGEGMDEDPTCSQYFPSKADNGTRLRSAFFNQPCVDLAKALLGKVSIEFIDNSLVK